MFLNILNLNNKIYGNKNLQDVKHGKLFINSMEQEMINLKFDTTNIFSEIKKEIKF